MEIGGRLPRAALGASASKHPRATPQRGSPGGRSDRSVRLEVTRGGDVVHGEDYRAASSVVLSRAEEAFGDGHLVSDLPGVAGRLHSCSHKM